MMQYPADQATPSAAARTLVLSGGRVTLPVRQRLLDQLFEETGSHAGVKRLTVCVAPTGYAKTRTIAQWLGDGSDKTDHVRWVHFSRGSSETIWHELLQELAPQSDDHAQTRDEALAEITRLSESLTSPVTLVLNNYHLATTPDNDLALMQLAASFKHLTLVVIGRSVGLLTSTLATARIRVRVIGTKDLALPLDEACELAENLGIPAGERLKAALEQTEGWPLAIRAALNIGSDTLYLNTPTHEWAGSPYTTPGFDPIMNLSSFAVDYLELTSMQARQVVLAAAQLDAITIDQITSIVGVSPAEADTAVQELLELGLLIEFRLPEGTEYSCSRAVKAPLEIFGARAITTENRKKLFRSRAEQLASTAPFTSFKLYCAAEDYNGAEIVLARNFTMLTEEVEVCGRVLRSIPETTQRLHPTFTAALLFLDTPRTSITPSALARSSTLWLESLKARLPENLPVATDPIYLPLLCQAMVATRITGQIEASVTLMNSLEHQLNSYLGPADQQASFSEETLSAELSIGGSLPTYYREGAATALAAGDYSQARRFLKRLQQHSEHRIRHGRSNFVRASTRTVSDKRSGERWLLAALSELALTKLLDGDMRRCAENVAEFDAAMEASGEAAPGISWVGVELARAHLSYDMFDHAMLEQASSALAPITDRLEHWPLLLIAEATWLWIERGADWAISHLQSTIASSNSPLHTENKWSESLTTFHTMLCTTTGNLTQAEQLLNSCTNQSPDIRLEQARISLFAGDSINAILIVQSIGDPEVTKRQRTDRCLIGAIAAWSIGRFEEAFTALSHASDGLNEYNLTSTLMGVPYDTLSEVAVAAKQAGVCDITAYLDAVPQKGRSLRYERLTEMELQTLVTISEHRSTNQAASALFVTPGTVKKHLASVYRKLRVNGRDEAILQAGRMGLLSLTAE